MKIRITVDIYAYQACVKYGILILYSSRTDDAVITERSMNNTEYGCSLVIPGTITQVAAASDWPRYAGAALDVARDDVRATAFPFMHGSPVFRITGPKRATASNMATGDPQMRAHHESPRTTEKRRLRRECPVHPCVGEDAWLWMANHVALWIDRHAPSDEAGPLVPR